MKTKERLESIRDILSDTQKRLTQVTKEMSVIDKSISDIHHVIEFYNFDAVTMVRLQKKLKELLIERREVKNENCELTSMVARFCPKDINEGVKHVGQLIKLNENTDDKKTYAVRVLTDIFGDNLKSSKRPNVKL